MSVSVLHVIPGECKTNSFYFVYFLHTFCELLSKL